MAVLSNQRRGAGVSRHNFTDDMGMVMGWLETLREMDSPYDCDGEEIYIAGSVNLPQVNRIRQILGMKPLPPACAKCHAATRRACICDPLNGKV
jgi:hypothetical protein